MSNMFKTFLGQWVNLESITFAYLQENYYYNSENNSIQESNSREYYMPVAAISTKEYVFLDTGSDNKEIAQKQLNEIMQRIKQ